MPKKVLAGLLTGALTLEVISRWIYQRQWGIPFEAKVIGEYPYDKLLEQQPSPLHYRLRENFSSPLITTNSLRMRCPEYGTSPGKKLLVIGESNLFGTKLRDQSRCWPWQLDRMLKQNGHLGWQILNASFPGYSVGQYKAWWDQELKQLKPDRVVISIGGNDFTQAHSMGSKWQPGAPWPFEFVLALKRARPAYYRWLGHSAAYFQYRRQKFGQNTAIFKAADEHFQHQECTDYVLETIGAIAREARELGADVAALGAFPAYDITPGREKDLDLGVLQGNWESIVDLDIKTHGLFLERYPRQMKEAGVATLEIQPYFLAHPNRTGLYFDLLHLNERGMDVLTRVLYTELNRLGWWTS